MLALFLKKFSLSCYQKKYRIKNVFCLFTDRWVSPETMAGEWIEIIRSVSSSYSSRLLQLSVVAGTTNKNVHLSVNGLRTGFHKFCLFSCVSFWLGISICQSGRKDVDLTQRRRCGMSINQQFPSQVELWCSRFITSILRFITLAYSVGSAYLFNQESQEQLSRKESSPIPVPASSVPVLLTFLSKAFMSWVGFCHSLWNQNLVHWRSVATFWRVKGRTQPVLSSAFCCILVARLGEPLHQMALFNGAWQVPWRFLRGVRAQSQEVGRRASEFIVFSVRSTCAVAHHRFILLKSFSPWVVAKFSKLHRQFVVAGAGEERKVCSTCCCRALSTYLVA
jgi:hypothetical protein